MAIFLKAAWRKLAFANYEIDPEILQKYVPAKTELDSWNGKFFVSLVGFQFCNTRLLGLRIPFHTNFEEVNLRFYVRYRNGKEWKRGVVFIKEIVPKPALTFVANTIYGEKYCTMPMAHHWQLTPEELSVSYQWKDALKWNTFDIRALPVPIDILADSKEEFITEHYWGYSQISKVRTSEYKVEHPKWQVYPIKDYKINVDFGKQYGSDFQFLSAAIPASVFLAEGSEIAVLTGKRI